MIGIKKQTEKYNSQAIALERFIMDVRTHRNYARQNWYNNAFAKVNLGVAESWRQIGESICRIGKVIKNNNKF